MDLDRELQQLPTPRAPETFLPRVMLAVAEVEARPWYSRAWVTWPRGLQVASAALLALAIVGAWQIMNGGPSWMPDAAVSQVSAAFAPLKPAARVAEQASTLGRVLWQVWLQPIALYFLALLILGSLMCGALWTTVNRLALGGASPR